MTGVFEYLVSLYQYIIHIPDMISQTVGIFMDAMMYPVQKSYALLEYHIFHIFELLWQIIDSYVNLLIALKDFFLNVTGAMLDSYPAVIIVLGVTIAIALRLYGLVRGKTYGIGIFGFEFEVTF